MRTIREQLIEVLRNEAIPIVAGPDKRGFMVVYRRTETDPKSEEMASALQADSHVSEVKIIPGPNNEEDMHVFVRQGNGITDEDKADELVKNILLAMTTVEPYK